MSMASFYLPRLRLASYLSRHLDMKTLALSAARESSRGICSSRSIPLHAQVEHALRRMIRQPEFQDGRLFPDELTLANQFGVSRGTMRVSLARLVDQRLLERKRGVGTKVLPAPAESSIAEWRSFSQEMARTGVTVECLFQDARLLAAPANVAAALQIGGGTEVLRLDRVRGWEDCPVLHSRSWFHPRLRLTKSTDFSRPLYEMIREETGAVAASAHEQFLAVNARVFVGTSPGGENGCPPSEALSHGFGSRQATTRIRGGPLCQCPLYPHAGFAKERRMILAADFGGTTIKLGVVERGTIKARRRLEAHADCPMPERLEAVARAWEELVWEAGGTLRECKGTAFALPFVADPERFRVLGEFGKFPGATTVDFAAWSQERLALPTALENDLRVALLGEWAAGAARGKSDVLMLALGTGIGCAVLCGNRLLRGANNRAATLLGHSTMDHQGSRGRCGNIGCAEDLASTATLQARARSHPAFAESKLAHAEKIDFETIFRLAVQGDVCCESLLKQSLGVWAVLLQNAVLAYDPELVLLGGGVLRSPEMILPAMESHLREYMPGLRSQTPVAAAVLGDDAALLGAEVLFQQTHPTHFP